MKHGPRRVGLWKFHTVLNCPVINSEYPLGCIFLYSSIIYGLPLTYITTIQWCHNIKQLQLDNVEWDGTVDVDFSNSLIITDEESKTQVSFTSLGQSHSQLRPQISSVLCPANTCTIQRMNELDGILWRNPLLKFRMRKDIHGSSSLLSRVRGHEGDRPVPT